MSPAPAHRLLVAGIGNIFFGDDGFGVEVAQRLARKGARPEVRVVDFGIRGIDLTYALLEGYEGAILVDAAQRGGAPGTLYVLEPQPDALPAEMEGPFLEPHALEPDKVLAAVRALGGSLGALRVVACEPASLGSEEEPAMGLSAPVAAAIEPAMALIESLVEQLLGAPHA